MNTMIEHGFARPIQRLHRRLRDGEPPARNDLHRRNQQASAAIQREKSIKKYKREWKINLIERENPYWDDFYPALVGLKRTTLNTEVMGRRDKPGDDEV